MTVLSGGQGPSSGTQDIRYLIDSVRDENRRADTTCAALLTVAGVVLAAFSLAAAGAATVPLKDIALWLGVAALTGVMAATELLFLAMRPKLNWSTSAKQFFGYWRLFLNRDDDLAAELNCGHEAARLLSQLSVIAWRKFRMIQAAIDVLLIVIPLICAAVLFTLIHH